MAVTGIDGTGSYPVYALDKARGNVPNETGKSNFNGKFNNVSESETTYALHGKQDAESGETAFFRTVLPDAGYELGRGGKRYYGFKSADG